MFAQVQCTPSNWVSGTLRTFVDAATTTIPGNSREARLRVVWGRIKGLYTALGVARRIPYLTLNKFWPDSKMDVPEHKVSEEGRKGLGDGLRGQGKKDSSGEPVDLHR